MTQTKKRKKFYHLFLGQFYENKTVPKLDLLNGEINDKTLLEKEVSNMIKSIETNWKKNNLIDTSVYNEVDLIIPISSINLTRLQKELLVNDKAFVVVNPSQINTTLSAFGHEEKMAKKEL